MNNLITSESYTAMKVVCSEIRQLLANYKHTGIVYEAQIKKLQEDIRMTLTSQKIAHVFQLEEQISRGLEQFEKNNKKDDLYRYRLEQILRELEYAMKEYR